MSDIRSPLLLYIKGGLMLFTGVLAGGLLLLDRPDARSVLLLTLCVWGFCRAYYFAFYVIDHYIEPGSRYAGLIDFLRRSRAREALSIDKPGERMDGTSSTTRSD